MRKLNQNVTKKQILKILIYILMLPAPQNPRMSEIITSSPHVMIPLDLYLIPQWIITLGSTLTLSALNLTATVT